jgi:hypothetical protein
LTWKKCQVRVLEICHYYFFQLFRQLKNNRYTTFSYSISETWALFFQKNNNLQNFAANKKSLQHLGFQGGRPTKY